MPTQFNARFNETVFRKGAVDYNLQKFKHSSLLK
jgi:hypothetical protein